MSNVVVAVGHYNDETESLSAVVILSCYLVFVALDIFDILKHSETENEIENEIENECTDILTSDESKPDNDALSMNWIYADEDGCWWSDIHSMNWTVNAKLCVSICV